MILYRLKSGDWIDRRDVISVYEGQGGKRFAKYRRYLTDAQGLHTMVCHEEIVQTRRKKSPERYYVKGR
jgi:hypothetical protein